MTIPEFRSNPIHTSRIREILSDDTMRLALATLHESNPAIDADPKDEAIVSARILSQMVGYQTFAAALRLMAEPIQTPIKLQPTYQPEQP